MHTILGTDPPPVDGQEPPVDGVRDEGTKNYRVDDETNETVDPGKDTISSPWPCLMLAELIAASRKRLFGV